MLALLFEGVGRREISIDFTGIAAKDGAAWQIDFPPMVAGIVRVVETPEGQDAVVTSATARVRAATAYLATESSRLRIELTATPTGPPPRALPTIVVDRATIPRAEFRTRVVTDGSLHCEARVSVRHRSNTRWTFRLPAASQLLACTINGEPANPGVLENGDLELPIAAPEKDGGSTVGIAYTASVPPFDPVRGDLHVSLPWTPLFVEEIDWRLALPGGYEASAFEGNVEVKPISDGDKNGDLHFQKHLTRGEAATVQIFYTKTQLN